MADEGAPQLIEPAPVVPEPVQPPPPASLGKPRGRPRGSKNKPKPPVIVTRESEAAMMRPVVLELAAGCDVAAAIAAFARRRGVGVSVLCGRGAVAAVVLRLPTSPTAATTVTLHGRFEILSLCGTVLPSAAGAAAPTPFSVSLAAAGGQVIGGTLAGEMTAADGVVVVAATFGNAEVHRLPPAEKEEVEERRGREEERQQPQQQQAVATSGGDVGFARHGGLVGLGGQMVHHPQHAEMVMWAQLPASRGPAYPSTNY